MPAGVAPVPASLAPAARAAACVPLADVSTLGEPDVCTGGGACAGPRERTVTVGDDVLEVGVVTEPTGAFAVTVGVFVEPTEGVLAFTVTVGVSADRAGVFTGTAGVVALIVGVFTETGGAFTDTVGVVTVAPVFVAEADGVVTEMLGTLTVPTGVLTGMAGVLTVTDGRLSEDAVGTCASATTSAEARQTERAFWRDLIRRAIHNS